MWHSVGMCMVTCKLGTHVVMHSLGTIVFMYQAVMAGYMGKPTIVVFKSIKVFCCVIGPITVTMGPKEKVT